MARQEVFNRFYEPCVHKDRGFYELQSKFSSKVHTIVKYTLYDTNDTQLSELQFEEETDKDNKKHAEIIVIEKLNKAIENEHETQPRKIVVEMHDTFSPCDVCSKALIGFKQGQEKEGLVVKIKITFAGFYRIKRPSCMETRVCDKHIKFDYGAEEKSDKQRQNEVYSTANLQGLKNLKDAGIELETFKPSTWEYIRKFLKVPLPGDMGRRNQEDTRMEADLKRILSTEALPRDIKQRKREDSETEEDNSSVSSTEDEGAAAAAVLD